MKNLILEFGKTFQHTVSGSAVSSGDVIVQGQFVGIAVTDGAVGETITVNLQGVYEVAKASADTPSVGAKLYWNSTNSELTTTASGNTFAGYAHEAAGNGDTVVNILLVRPGS